MVLAYIQCRMNFATFRLSPKRIAARRVVARISKSRIAQVFVLVSFWQAGDGLSRVLHLPIPGAVIGLFLVLGLLGMGWLKLGAVRRGANWFVGEMLLFFVPPVLAVLDHPEFASWLGVKLLAAIVLGTGVVMAVTAITVEVCHRWLLAVRPHANG